MSSSANTSHFIGIMAKAPWPGYVKTRLTHALPPAVAADLYYRFLLDTIDVVRQVDNAKAVLLCPPGDARALTNLDLGLPVLEQPEPGLMQGLAFGIDHGLAGGFMPRR